MNAQTLAMLYGVNYHVLGVNTQGLTHQESLLQPRPAGNCVNWVLGHILSSRNGILRLAGENPIWGEADAARYKRGSKPVVDGADTVRLEKMLADLGKSQDALLAALTRLSPEALAQESPDGTLAERLAILQFHEAYHAGQLGLLRRLIGKPGAIQ